MKNFKKLLQTESCDSLYNTNGLESGWKLFFEHLQLKIQYHTAIKNQYIKTDKHTNPHQNYEKRLESHLAGSNKEKETNSINK